MKLLKDMRRWGGATVGSLSMRNICDESWCRVTPQWPSQRRSQSSPYGSAESPWELCPLPLDLATMGAGALALHRVRVCPVQQAPVELLGQRPSRHRPRREEQWRDDCALYAGQSSGEHARSRWFDGAVQAPIVGLRWM